MKKFNVKNNIAVVVTEDFKSSIYSATEFTSRERNAYGQNRYDMSFIGTVVTFNPSNQSVEYFGARAFVNSHDDKSEINSLMNDKIKRISLSDEYSNNELIAVIYASDFEYYGHGGYASNEEFASRNLKIENKFMSLYIDIIGRMNDDSVQDSDLSIRTKSCLLRAGYETIQQVEKLSLDEISRVRNLGRNSLEELEKFLNIKFV